MRFNQIHLTRFGCFTNHVIDFGEPSSSGDFHIVYGPNEAGKSTLRDACLDFLYGISARSKYNFFHDYSVMEVGARITAAGKSYEAKRIKGRKDTLIGVGDAPLSETTLKAILGGISREGYEHMYSLNDASLETGGESILSSEGDLGALLFGAMSGLSDISASLTKTKEQAEKFFKSSGRTFYLNELKNELKQIDQKIKDSDIEAGIYHRLKSEAKQAENQWCAKKKERDKKRTENRRLQSLIEAHPIWQEYVVLQHDTALLLDAPDVPDGWDNEVNELIQKNTEARSKAEAETQAVERAQVELNAIVCDENLLSLADQIKRLQKDELEARFRTSRDIEQRKTERQRLQDNIESKLSSLGQSVDTDAKTLILPVARVGEIKSLMEKIATIESEVKSALREYDNAKSESEEAKQELEEYKIPKTDPDKIQSALELAKEAPKSVDLKAIETTVNTARAERNSSIAILSPWRGDAAALSNLPLPGQELLQRLEIQSSELLEENRELSTEDRRLRDALAEHVSIIDVLIQEAKIISDETAANARQQRDEAWILHRRSLSEAPLPSAESLQKSADKFVAALAADDQLVSNRFNQSTDIARLREVQLNSGTTTTKLDRLEERQQEHIARQQVHTKELEELFVMLNLPSDFELSELKVWLERCRQALKAEEHLKTVDAEFQMRQEQYQTARTGLENAMQSYGLSVENLDWRQLLELGQKTVGIWTQAQQTKIALEESLSKAKKAEAKRKRELEAAQAEETAWSEAWLSCLAKTWLGQQTHAAVGEILNTLDSLAAEIKESAQLDDRITAMTDDRELYCAEVHRLAQLASEQFEESDPLSTADSLRKRVSDAEDAYKAKQKATKSLEDAEDRLAVELQRENQVSYRFKELRKTIPADNLEELRGKIGRGLERSRLQKRSVELENDLIRRLNQQSIEASLTLLNGEVGTPEVLDNVKTQCEAFERDLLDIDQQVSELYAVWQQFEKQLQTIGSDSTAAELVEQRQALILEIEAEAHNYMRLSTGVMLANEALRIYRETHRSSMMEAASAAFSRITRGAFKGLSTAIQDDKELLFGERTNGSTILAPEMSRGTRYQLYLALRIAGHAELTRNSEALPFFADDILEPFDDDRSSETFTLLNEVAKQGQVVYLTHHRHLCNLAQKITNGKVKVNELPDRVVPSKTATF